MSKHRTHYAHLTTGELAGSYVPLCGQKRKLLLELLVTQHWAQVTCQRCLTHRPTPLPTRGWFARKLEAFFGWFR